MRLKQEVLDAMVDLEWQVSQVGTGCQCGAPNAHPPCSYCTHPGNPYVLELEESWEKPEHHASYWAMRAKASAILRGAGLVRADDEYLFVDKVRGFSVGLGWCEVDNKPYWFASSVRRVVAGQVVYQGWRQNFDDVEAALAFGVVELSNREHNDATVDKNVSELAAHALSSMRTQFKNTFTG